MESPSSLPLTPLPPVTASALVPEFGGTMPQSGSSPTRFGNLQIVVESEPSSSFQRHNPLPSLCAILSGFLFGWLRWPSAYNPQVENLLAQSGSPPAFDHLTDLVRHCDDQWDFLSMISVVLFTTVIGCLQINGFSATIVISTLAILCMLSCLVCIGLGWIIRRHLSQIRKEDVFHWIENARNYSTSRFRSVPHLLAGPALWFYLAIALFILMILLVTFVTVSSGASSGGAQSQFVAGPLVVFLLGLAVAHLALVIHTTGRLANYPQPSEA